MHPSLSVNLDNPTLQLAPLVTTLSLFGRLLRLSEPGKQQW